MNFNTLKYKGLVGFYIYLTFYKLYWWLKNNRLSDKRYLKRRFKKAQGYDLNIDNPITLNEKINWLKLNYSHPLEHVMADKFAVRQYIAEKFGEEYLVPLLFETTNPDDIVPDILPDIPFIIKANHDSGSYIIVKDKKDIDWKKAKFDFKFWLSRNYYWVDREPQYKKIQPRIIIEKLLLTKSGKIPNDYKLHCINGQVEFIYVSIDREGINKRNIYNKNWEPLYFTWAYKSKDIKKLRGEEINKPSTLSKMIEFSETIAKEFPYIRVDFYDVDGKLYFGEITQHHGGGFDQIRPIEWDYRFGNMLNLKNEI